MKRLALLLWLVAFPAAAADCPDCPELVAIPGGTLVRDGAPPVEVAPLFMARTEITFDQLAVCVRAGACRGGQSDHGWGRGSRPVINVTHGDAEAYAAWLSGLTGKRYRLPTEDEWEWAARGGTSTTWWWGDTVGEGHANCRNCGTEWSGKMSAPVASLPPNPYGLHDMAGNVWEWVADCWHPDRAAAPHARDCSQRITKGGAWYYIPSQSQPTTRARNAAGLWSYTVGFRVVREY
ncbi:MAG: SUMF1/EgtB/PvdO family nonheme iron enzyme [Rhodospirillaceae bacterium]